MANNFNTCDVPGPIAHYSINTSAPASAAAAAAVAEYPGSTRRLKAELSRCSQARTAARVSSAWSAGTKLACQYSLDGSTWFYMGGTASGSAPTSLEYLDGGSVNTTASLWVTLPAAARADVHLRCVTLDGDNVATGAAGNIALQAR